MRSFDLFKILPFALVFSAFVFLNCNSNEPLIGEDDDFGMEESLSKGGGGHDELTPCEEAAKEVRKAARALAKATHKVVKKCDDPSSAECVEATDAFDAAYEDLQDKVAAFKSECGEGPSPAKIKH